MRVSVGVRGETRLAFLQAPGFLPASLPVSKPALRSLGCGPGRGAAAGASFVVVSSAWRAEGGRAWVGRLAARAWWPPGLPGGGVARGERAST